MTQPHILFIANDVLGWSTYNRQFESALQARQDVRASVLHRVPSRWVMQLARRHADGPRGRMLRPFDPIRLHAGFLGRDIRRAVTALSPDIVHVAAHWPAGALLPGPLPVTLALDTTRPVLTRDLPLPGWSEAECRTEAELCRAAAHLLPMSSWAAQSLQQDFGIPAERMTIQPPALDPARWPEAAQPNNAVAQILFVGNNLRRKGAHRLASWVAGPLAGRCHLHIVSADPDTPPQGPDLTCHGPIPHARLLSEIFPRMDIFCLPTRLDMSPFVIVEAAAAGLPVVASDLGGIPDLVAEGETGHLVPAGDDSGFIQALGALIDDPARRVAMGATARSRARVRFDGSTNFNQLIDRLVEIVAARKAAG